MRPSLLTDQLMRNRNLILRHFSRGLDLPQIDGAVYTFYLFLVSPHTPLTSSTMCNPNVRHTWRAEGGSSVDLVDVPGSERVRGPLVEK